MLGRGRKLLSQIVARRSGAEWRLTLGAVGLVFVALLVATWLTPYQSPSLTTFYAASQQSGDVAYLRAEVVNAEAQTVKLLDSARSGQVVRAEHLATTLSTGDTVIVYQREDDTALIYSLYDRWRLPGLVAMMALFLLLVVVVAGRQGAMSVTGLFLSLVIIMWGIIPLLLSGWPAFWTCLAGALVIACVSILVAHGLRRRTYISLVVICAIILGVALLAWLAIALIGLTGMSDETAYFASEKMRYLDMRGVLAGGIIIASLGVLDDIITTQVAAVEELSKANPRWSGEQLYTAARSIGREHIASLVNTLALAYAGAALPFILLVSHSSALSPLLTLNSEYIATEIVRTLVASSSLVLAVPVSTVMAVYLLHSRPLFLRRVGQRH